MSRLRSQPEQLSCPICYQLFNSSTKRPIIICSNNHSICVQCLANLSSFTCPFCRALINFSQPDSYYHQFQANQHSYIIRIIHPSQLSILFRLGIMLRYLMIVTMVINVPLLVFNLIFLVSDSDPACMDTHYNFITARQYFLIMVIWGLVNYSLLLIRFIMRNICDFGRAQWHYRVVSNLAFILSCAMMIFWVVFEPILFFMVVRYHCLGGIYVYCLFQTIFVISSMPILGIARFKFAI